MDRPNIVFIMPNQLRDDYQNCGLQTWPELLDE
jgi:hypothetical protein